MRDQHFTPLRTVFFGCVLLAALASGCWLRGPKVVTYPVSGKVSYLGKPVTEGSVVFNPTTTGEIPAVGNLDSSGHFVLSTPDVGAGAVAGEHKVLVFSRVAVVGDTGKSSKAPTIVQSRVPEKFSLPEKTTIKRVVENRDNFFEINLDEEK